MILLSKSDKTKEVSLCVPIKKGKMKYSSMQSQQKRRLHGVITVANILNMLALLLDYLIKEEARMKYINANSLLPDKLVKELQRYIQGGYIYIPVDEKQHRYWGELSGYKEELRKRMGFLSNFLLKNTIFLFMLSEKLYIKNNKWESLIMRLLCLY